LPNQLIISDFLKNWLIFILIIVLSV